MKKIIACLISVVFLMTMVGCRPQEQALSREVTVLMYHHFDEKANNYTVVSGDRFREQLLAFKNAGYESITLHQLLDFEEGAGDLPEKPLLITMDDGYTSNLTIAAPILQELAMTATVFVIGINEGQTRYAHSGEVLSPARFAYAEAQPWVDRGVLEIQSHTYDLHQRADYGFSGREGVLSLSGESDAHYQGVLMEDCKTFKEARQGKISTELFALAYPFGFHTAETDRLLESEFKITFTTAEHTNTVTQGDPSSLRMLGRFNASGELSGDALLQRVKN